MKAILSKIPPVFKNFYVLGSAFFFIWILVFDSNDIITQMKLTSKESELEKTKQFYLDQIEEVNANREALMTSDALLEEIAREKYFMKKDGEDVFVVVEVD